MPSLKDYDNLSSGDRKRMMAALAGAEIGAGAALGGKRGALLGAAGGAVSAAALEAGRKRRKSREKRGSMDKIALYEMLLEDHPFWTKEAKKKGRVFAGGDGIPLRETNPDSGKLREAANPKGSASKNRLQAAAKKGKPRRAVSGRAAAGALAGGAALGLAGYGAYKLLKKEAMYEALLEDHPLWELGSR